MVGFGEVLQQIPRAVMGDPPSDVMSPPLEALVHVTDEMAVVERTVENPVPVAVKLKTGVSASFEGIEIVADLAPMEAGEKRSVRVVVAPDTRVAAGGFSILKVPLSTPEPRVRVIPDTSMSRSFVPEFLMVIVVSALSLMNTGSTLRVPPEAMVLSDTLKDNEGATAMVRAV